MDLAPWHGSGRYCSLAMANCYIVIPPDREHIPAGEWVALVLRSSPARECPLPALPFAFAWMWRSARHARREDEKLAMANKLSHYDRLGPARMVDVPARLDLERAAEASAFVALRPAVLRLCPTIPKAIRSKWRGWRESWRPNAPPIYPHVSCSAALAH